MKRQATITDLIRYLEDNFKQEDRFCFWHEGGAWIECEYVRKTDLGKWFFKTVKTDKDSRIMPNDSEDYKKSIESDYKQVNDSDIIVY